MRQLAVNVIGCCTRKPWLPAATAGMPDKVTLFDEEIRITESDKLKHRNKKPPTFLSALWEGAMRSKSLLLIIVAVGAWQAYRGSTLGLALAGLSMLAWCAFLVVVSLPSIYYGRLHKAADWYRWDEVLDIVEKLKAIGKFHFIKVPAPELGRYRAKAMAGSGKLSEALEEYRQYENQPGCPSWLYKAHVAVIFDVAQKHSQAVEWNLRAIEEKPSPVMYLDLANRYARRIKDPLKARAALAEAEKGTIPDAIKAGHSRIRGIVAFAEGDFTAARRELEASLEAMNRTPHQLYRDGSVSIARAYLCCVLAKLGDHEGAKRNFAVAREYLIATGETQLLHECQRLAGE